MIFCEPSKLAYLCSYTNLTNAWLFKWSLGYNSTILAWIEFGKPVKTKVLSEFDVMLLRRGSISGSNDEWRGLGGRSHSHVLQEFYLKDICKHAMMFLHLLLTQFFWIWGQFYQLSSLLLDYVAQNNCQVRKIHFRLNIHFVMGLNTFNLIVVECERNRENNLKFKQIHI